jgi:hypothetical protein
MRYLFKSYWEAIVKFNTNATYSLLANSRIYRCEM